MATSQNRHLPRDTVLQTGWRSPVGRVLAEAQSAIIGVGVFSFFVNLLMLTGPIYMLQVYDRVLLSASMETLVFISVAMMILYLFMGLFDFWRSRVLVRVADEFEALMNSKTFASWLRQSNKSGDAARSAPLNDVSTLRQFLSGNAPGAFFDLPWVPVFIALIWMLHWTLGLLAIFGTVVICITAFISSKRTQTPLMESLRLRRAEQLFAATAQRNSEAIAAMGMGENIRARWALFNTQGARETVNAADRTGGGTAFTKAFRMFLQSAILGAGGALAIQQIITPGAMIAGSIILGRALAPVQMLLGQWRAVGAAKDAYDRLNHFHEEGEEAEKALTQLPEPTGHLIVEKVTAGPPGASRAILTGLNFAVQPGQGLGVIGPSASGKSTLARMLVGVWMPQRGSIRLDGATFDQWDRERVGAYIGYLPQRVELFEGTIAENIARFDPNMTDDAVVAAAQCAGVHDLILHLPDGYETKVGIGHAVLSGGQTQRIGLARALYGDPKLIVLDEPNASLDHEGDQALTQAIAQARAKGAVVIVMAHRPSAIAAVDLILSLRDGRQDDFGPKEAVLAALREKTQTGAKTATAKSVAKPGPIPGPNPGLNPGQKKTKAAAASNVQPLPKRGVSAARSGQQALFLGKPNPNSSGEG
jgi:PrtD family type I secretion system ABC transporter